MVSTNEFKTGLTVTIDNDPWQVVEFQHVKPGKGAAFVRAKMRNLATGAVVERTFNAGERLPKANIDRRIMQYLYEGDGNYVFMDNDTYEQTELTKEQIGNGINFLKENMDVKVISYENRVLGVELPNTVELVVVKTEPGIRGDTATGGSKPASTARSAAGISAFRRSISLFASSAKSGSSSSDSFPSMSSSILK